MAKAEWEGQRVGRGPFLNAVAEMSASVLAEYVQPLNVAPVATTLYTQASPGGYAPGYQADTGSHQAPSVSWNDPDIAYSPPPSRHPEASTFAGSNLATGLDPAKEVSLEEHLGDFPDNVQSLASHEVAEWEATLNQSMAPHVHQHNDSYDEPAREPLPARESQPYSYSPPQHSVEQFSVPSAPNIGEAGYIPSFKRGMENEPSAPTTSPQTAPDTSGYISPQEKPAKDAPKSGYVPHFIDEKQNDDKDSFWDES